MSEKDAVALILGSAFYSNIEALGAFELEHQVVETPFGDQGVWRVRVGASRDAYLIARHGVPHTLLPHQINWRAMASALSSLGVGALVTTSSVGVMDPSLPVQTPMLLADLLMPHNTLPDGTACTMFPEPTPGQGHLVIEDGIFSSALNAQIRDIATRADIPLFDDEVVFAYVGGPRTKTPAENRFFLQLGAQVNSMTVGPEVVLANELEIPCAGLVAGHKRSSGQQAPDVEGDDQITTSLDDAREVFGRLLVALIEQLSPVPFANQIYRFGGEDD